MSGWKKALSLFLCGALALGLLAACGEGQGNENGNVTYGRYVEKDISPPNMEGSTRAFASFAGGVLDLISVADRYENDVYKADWLRWRSADNGSTWQAVDMSWVDQYNVDYTEYYNRGEEPPEYMSLGYEMVPMENGDLLANIQRSGNNAETGEYWNTVEFIRVGLDGSAVPFSIPEMEQQMAEGYGGYINTLRALPGNRLYLHYSINPGQEFYEQDNPDYNSLEKRGVYDLATGQKLYDVNFNGWNMYSNDTTLFLYDYNTGISAINISDGSPSSAPMPSEEAMQRIMYGGSGGTFVDNQNNFYTVSAKGMYRYLAESGTGSTGGGQSSQSQSSQGGQSQGGAQPRDGSGGTTAGAPEQVMEGLNYTFGSPLYNIGNMVFNTEDDSMVMAVYEYDRITWEQTGRLLRYDWDDEAIASSDEKVRVYSLYENYSVRLALSEFKRLYPEVFVEYEVAFGTDDSGSISPLMYASGDYSASMGGSGGTTGMTEEDALRALNTELLNGTGPDVIVLDGLPVESFISKGILLDLASIVDGNNDLFPSIFQPMKRDGKIYAVPTNFFVPTLFGEKGYVDQFTSLQSLVSGIEAGAGLPTSVEPQDDWTDEDWNNYWNTMNAPKPDEEQPVMYFESLQDLTATLYATCAPAIFSEKGGIDQANLTTFLEAVKKISDKYGLADPDSMGYSSGYAVSMMGGSYYNYSYSATLNRYTQRQGRLGYSRLGSISTLQDVSTQLYYSATNNMGKEIVEYDDEGNPIESTEPVQQPETLPAANPLAISAPGLSSGAYFPTQMVGVTSTSKKQELARQFVSTMLSGDVQKNDMGNGFPVSRTAFSTMYDSYLKMAERYKYNGEGPDMMAFDYEGMIGSLTTPFYVNDYVRAAITDPIADYCAGNTSLEQVVQKIVDETELYFAERQ